MGQDTDSVRAQTERSRDHWPPMPEHYQPAHSVLRPSAPAGDALLWVGRALPSVSHDDPHVAYLQRFPIKALDREELDSAELTRGGSLEGDRAWAIVEGDADRPHDPDDAALNAYVNGKKTERVHRLRTSVDFDAETVEVGVEGERAAAEREFSLSAPGDLNDWLSDYFDRRVSVRRGDDVGFPDRRDAPGPTVTSTATMDTVAEWFGIPRDEARRRFRANVEIGGVPAFWEDRLFAGGKEVVRFRVGDAVFEGVKPCGRCVVPTRDADTGEEDPAFREAFIERREATLPEWVEESRFDHAYKLAVVTRAADDERIDGCELGVGDEVEILGTEPR